MANYAVKLTPAAERSFRKLPRAVQVRITKKIEDLRSEPRPSGVKKLTDAGDKYRLRDGDYRIIYQIEDKALIIEVVDIGNRDDIYR